MTSIAPHITAFLQQRLPVERRASPNTCDSYAHAFKLLFHYASACLKVPPSELNLEQIDSPLIVNFLGPSGKGPRKRRWLPEHPSCGHQVVHALHGVSSTLCAGADSAHSGDSG